jgi:transposase, IS30 family
VRGQELLAVEREQIMIGVARDESCRVIAGRLGRNHTVVSREIARNGGRDSYRSGAAQDRADRRRTRPKLRKLERKPDLHEVVAAGLTLEWSPRQVSQRLRRDYPDDMGMRISPETIYETLFVQARGECRTQLRLALRCGRVRRLPRGVSRPTQARISGMVNISERPAEAADRAVPGHWESDLIIGEKGRSQILTLVERTTRFVILQKIPYDRCADRVALLLSKAAQRLPQHVWRSITHDQGVEMADHATFTVKTSIPVFFCDPHSPWQRGSNENTNGLLRQYFPKGTDLSYYSQAELDAVADRLNGRPRQTLNWMTPAEKLDEFLLKPDGALTD